MTYILQCCSYKCVLSIFIYKIALHNTDFGVLQKSSKHFWFHCCHHLLSACPSTPPPPSKKIFKMRAYFLQSCSLKCVLPIFIIYNVASQNTDLGVFHKTSKHFIISIFTPSLSHLRSVLRASYNSDLFVYNFVVKNVFCQYLYTI